MVREADSPSVCLEAGQTKRRSYRTNEVAKYDRPSQALRRIVVTLPPPVQDHLIHLLPQGLHVGIGKASVQRAHAVGVVARSVDSAVASGLG